MISFSLIFTNTSWNSLSISNNSVFIWYLWRNLSLLLYIQDGLLPCILGSFWCSIYHDILISRNPVNLNVRHFAPGKIFFICLFFRMIAQLLQNAKNVECTFKFIYILDIFIKPKFTLFYRNKTSGCNAKTSGKYMKRCSVVAKSHK
jgi:hypothetical protein